MSVNKSRGLILGIIVLILVHNTAPLVINAADHNQDLFVDALKEDVSKTYDTSVVKPQEFIINGQLKAELVYPESKKMFNNGNYDKMYFKSYLVNTGDMVKKGDPIAKIRVPVNESKIEEIKLSIQKEEENLKAFNREYQTIVDKYSDSSRTSNPEKDSQLSQLLSARLQMNYQMEKQNKEAKISQLKKQYKDYLKLKNNGYILYIYAACKGMIEDLGKIYGGNKVEAGEYIATIADTSKVLICSETDSDDLMYNMPVTVKQQDLVLKGRVITCNNRLLSHSLYSNTLMEVYGDDVSKLRNTEVIVTYRSADMKNVLVVDNDAVLKDDYGRYVNLLIKGLIKKQYVICGPTGGDKTLIMSGIKEGDIVLRN